jgi:hypothetical protein
VKPGWLSDAQEAFLRDLFVAGDGGILPRTDFRAAESLVRRGLATRGTTTVYDRFVITSAGRAWLASKGQP